MNRTPPVEVRRILRQEVGFGCPVDGCRQAFLTWHHFDPPWNVEQHHRPEGMIALCRPHHDAADQGVYSQAELKELKQSVCWRVQPARAKLPWTKREFLVRLGGYYTGGTEVPIIFGGERVIWLRRMDNGLLSLSFRLRAADGSVIAEMEDNMFEADPSRLYDLEANTGGTKLKFWLHKRGVGLDLSFKRVTQDELSSILEADRQDSDKRWQSNAPAIQDSNGIAAAPQELQQQSDLPARPKEIHENKGIGMTGAGVIRWASSNCLDDEQRIPLLNFENVVIHRGGRWLVIRDGIATSEGINISYIAIFGAAVAGIML
jgi:hypothetical protein